MKPLDAWLVLAVGLACGIVLGAWVQRESSRVDVALRIERVSNSKVSPSPHELAIIGCMRAIPLGAEWCPELATCVVGLQSEVSPWVEHKR